MKKIASEVYENLTPRQRIIAAIEAESRQDQYERIRLIRTCRKVSFTQNDPEFAGTMENLMTAAVAVEADLRGCALSFYFALRVGPKSAFTFLQEFADIREAWHSTISGMGIDPVAMKNAGPPPNPILEFIDDIVPKPKKNASRYWQPNSRNSSKTTWRRDPTANEGKAP